MPRSTTAWAAMGAAAVLMLSGCSFFGIDTRPDIRYVTESQRKEVSEPMYSMPVPGTGLFKQWPMRLGPEYGYAPWERKPSGTRPTVDATAAGPVATGHAAAGATTTGAANVSSAAAPNGVALAASGDAANGTKPSSRATPRLPGGELATAATVATATPAVAMAADRAPAAAGNGLATAGEPTHLVADDFDVPVAARGTLDFRTPAVARAEATVSAPATAAPPQAAASMVARAPAAAAATRPAVDANLPWRTTGDEAEAAAANGSAGSAMPSAPGVSLQQPGVFSARKIVAATTPQREIRTATTSPRNVLRDEAVRPASAEMPVSPGKATLPNTFPPMNTAPPSSAQGAAAARVPRELVPPGDFGYDGDLGGEVGGDVGGETGAMPGVPASAAARTAMGSTASREAVAAEGVYASPYARQPVAAPRSAAGVEMVGTPRSEPGPRVVRPAAEVDDEEPVFVTATDMSDEDVPVAREYTNPYYRPSDGASGNVAGDAGRAGSGAGDGGVLSELEAAKQSILR